MEILLSVFIKHESYVKNKYVNIKGNPISLDNGILHIARLSSTLGALFSKLALSPLKPSNIVPISHFRASLVNL